MKPLAIATLIVLAAAGSARADEPRAQLRLEAGRPHTNVPFVIDLIVEGFDESPQPEQPKLAIEGAKVTPLGVQPNVSRSIQIVNGRRSESSRVTWSYRWRVEVAQPGAVHVPALTVTQGNKHATASAGDVDVDTVPTTDDMKLELTLPSRPVFVGEAIEAKLTWLFRRQPEDQTFSVPMLGMDELTVSAPPVVDQRRMLQISAGAKELQLPYDIDDVEVGGAKFHRVSLRLFVAPKQSGKLMIPPSSVVAGLAVGRADFFGQSRSELFRANDVAHTLEVKPLPESDRPASFAGAVGSEFSIQVGTSRSVVQLGEPVELAITVKSNQRLDTLALGRLDGDGGLPKDKFTVPAEPPTGELSDDGKTKTFKVTAQVTGPANEIPAIAFSYFDPVKGTYQTIHSDPIAVSVKGGSVVGANDVVAAAQKKSAAPAEADLALVGADLALSDAPDYQPSGGGWLGWLVIGVLYFVPLTIFGVRWWMLRTAAVREEAGEVKIARRRVEDELRRAASAPGREVAGPIVSALREFARAAGHPMDDPGLLAKLETESFAPGAASAPLSTAIQGEVAALLRRWTVAKRTTPNHGRVAWLAIAIPVITAPIVFGVCFHFVDHRSSDEPIELRYSHSFDDARDTYRHAMTVTDPSARKAEFSRAAASLGRIVSDVANEPGRPELLTDWGNAALGAGDVANATLGYRRALAVDAGNVRARRNLAWLRGRQTDTLRPTTGTAADMLFFFHEWPRTRRVLDGALAFALAVLLVVPWTGRRRRGLTALAMLPLAVWIAMIVSIGIEDRHLDDAIVMDAVVLRAADSAGAPAALTQPLPRGAEVTVLERRDAWTKIRLPSGTAGWVPDGSVERIATR